MPAHPEGRKNPSMDTLTHAETVLPIVDSLFAIPGFANGLHYPSLRMRLSFPSELSSATLETIANALQDALQRHGLLVQHELACKDPFAFFITALHLLQSAARLPIHESGRILQHQPPLSAFIAIPTLTAGLPALTSAAQWLAQFMHAIARQQDISTLHTRLERIVNHLSQSGPTQSNIHLLLKAALKLDIPFIEIGAGTYQFGYSAKSQWLLSSFTENTSCISSTLARNKFHAASLMQRQGIPVPAHYQVNSESGALKAAQQLGFPVVVKPANLDGGAGVSAGLMSPDEVSSAYRKAAELSTQILVEQHIEGRDYRLVVMNDELIWAIERVPGGVTGDGVSSILQLLAQDTLERERTGQNTLKAVTLDDEALACLKRAGLEGNSIPAAGQFVRLRSIANIGAGGVPVPVMHHVHPDNRALAIRAAAALRLDIAGIDLLIPDIAISWKVSGGAICEINAQPQLGSITSAHLYEHLLNTRLSQQGRIPIVVVLGLPPAEIPRVAEAVSRSAAIRHLRLGILKNTDLFRAGQSLLLDKQIDACLIFVNEDSALKTGLPFDRIDALVMAGDHRHLTFSTDNAVEKRWSALIGVLMSACQTPVLVLDSASLKISNRADAEAANRIITLPRAELTSRLTDALLKS